MTDRLKYRWLWTWDHRMRWDLNERGAQDSGCHNPYLKSPTAFLRDYRRLIDHMSHLKLNGLVVWGLLRDAHGGLSSAQKLCAYARSKGVRIIAGTGVLAYGGVWYEGKHRYNLATHLEKHPELAAVDENGNRLASGRTAVACPSRPENREWMEAAVSWLARLPDLGGITFETGDYQTCCCPTCRDKQSDREARVSFLDMAEMLPGLCGAARRESPRLWLSFASYTTFAGRDCFGKKRSASLLSSLDSIPDYAARMWTLTTLLARQGSRFAWERQRLPKPVGKANLGVFHQGRAAAVPDVIRSACALAHKAPLDGMIMYGEISPMSIAHEINYLAFSAWTQCPNLTPQGFAKRLTPLLGKDEATARFYVDVLLTPDRKRSAKVIRAIDKQCRSWEARLTEEKSWAVFRRWAWLRAQLKGASGSSATVSHF